MVADCIHRFKKEFLKGIIFGLKFPKEEILQFIQTYNQNGFDDLKYQQVERNGLEIYA